MLPKKNLHKSLRTYFALICVLSLLYQSKCNDSQYLRKPKAVLMVRKPQKHLLKRFICNDLVPRILNADKKQHLPLASCALIPMQNWLSTC